MHGIVEAVDWDDLEGVDPAPGVIGVVARDQEELGAVVFGGDGFFGDPANGADGAVGGDGAGAGHEVAAGQVAVGDGVENAQGEHEAGRWAADVIGLDVDREGQRTSNM